MNSTSQHGIKQPTGTLSYRVLGLTKKFFWLKVKEPRFAFRLRRTAPGSLEVRPSGCIYIYMYTHVVTSIAKFVSFITWVRLGKL